MATGPAHYRAAEALLSNVVKDRRLGTEGQERFLALAQAHATLALAAATANITGEPQFSDYGAWPETPAPGAAGQQED